MVERRRANILPISPPAPTDGSFITLSLFSVSPLFMSPSPRSNSASRWTFLITSFGIPFILSLLLFPQYIFVLFTVIIIAILLRLYLYKIFGGVNGDIVGASGEIGRMFALLLSTISIFLV